LVWTVEDLLSEREEEVKEGWFSSAERQVFKLDAFAPDSGLSRMDRMVILPERPYQVLAELNQPGLRDLRKFVVGASGQILPAR